MVIIERKRPYLEASFFEGFEAQGLSSPGVFNVFEWGFRWQVDGCPSCLFLWGIFELGLGGWWKPIPPALRARSRRNRLRPASEAWLGNPLQW